jgi:hypothetical protein
MLSEQLAGEPRATLTELERGLHTELDIGTSEEEIAGGMPAVPVEVTREFATR